MPKTKPQEGNLRIWWIPQVPMSPFHASVKTVREGKLLLNTLADYDFFQLKNNIKPDYSNVGGLEIFEGGEWSDWSNESGQDIDDLNLSELP